MADLDCGFNYVSIRLGIFIARILIRGVHKMNLILFCLQDESFLEDINMILNTGDIPNLYDNEERLEIIEKVK